VTGTVTTQDAAADAGRAAIRGGARAGLVVRAVFYLLLTYLTVRVATIGGGGQVDANGALRIIGTSVLDSVVLGFAAAGFAVFGLVRLHAAWNDRAEPRLRRSTTALQGFASLVVAWIPLSFALGDDATGSEQSQRHSTQELLGLPGGRVIVVVVGLIVLGWTGWQIRGALRRDHEDGLMIDGSRPWVQRTVKIVAASGLLARALVIAPIGVLLVVAGVTYDAAHERGLDGELLALSHHTWGSAALALVALGLLDFAAYALIEARYRRVDRAA
jgi:hypothetical protein